MAVILDGKSLSKKIESELILRVEKIKQKLGFTPILATILVGNDEASKIYVNMKKRACERVGIESLSIELDENITTQNLIDEINKLNDNKKVVGILLQHPVPKQIDEQKCFNTISIEKDVDGVNSTSFGLMSMGREAFLSATPKGIMTLLDYYKVELQGKNAVVVGRSAILGKPIAMALLNKDCTVTICHSKTKNLVDILKNADIVIGACGKPKFIQKEWLKEDVILIDAGYNKGNVGDIDLENCINVCSMYTPVPGGVGPMTIASLLLQTVESAENLLKSNK